MFADDTTIMVSAQTPEELNSDIISILDEFDIGRAAIKGGRVSPGTRPPQQPRVPIKQPPRTAEALAVLVQHLVFNLEAFKNPSLKKEAAKARLVAEEALLSCQQLEDLLAEERQLHTGIIGEERIKYRAEITQLIEQNRTNISYIQLQHEEQGKKLLLEQNSMKGSLTKLHETQLQTFKIEFEKLQKTHQESLDILREENDAIRDQLDEKNVHIKDLEHYKFESEKLKKDYECKEASYKKQLASVQVETVRLREENDSFVGGRFEGDDTSFMEVHSLRSVLELKLAEVAELRKALAEANQKADMLPAAEEKVSVLSAKCEDMQLQLERKTDYEQQLMSDHKKLQDSFKEEINKQKRIARYNEELQWRLKQNKEVVTKVIEEAEATAFNRSLISSSFNEKHHSCTKPNFERTMSFRERSLSNKSNASQGSNRSLKSNFELDEDMSPPNSPKVKGVVEKSDSVSYVLEMDESPEVVASRIVRRSFRNTTPPKNTPTKSPSSKRPRMKNNPLCLSASASSIMTTTKSESLRTSIIFGTPNSLQNSDLQCNEIGSSHSDDAFTWDISNVSTPNTKKCPSFWSSHTDFDEDLEDIHLPALPSEIGRKLETLPAPKHLAGEAMISESNSEDESSTSSSSAQL